jgi:hypothetical protein
MIIQGGAWDWTTDKLRSLFDLYTGRASIDTAQKQP